MHSGAGPMIPCQSAPERLHPVQRTHAGARDEELQVMRRTEVVEVHEGLCHV